MQQHGSPRFSLDELVDASGIPERTIRFYISKGLVPPAMGRGRSAYYTPEHLAQLEHVNTLRKQKLSLDEIYAAITPMPAADDTPAFEDWRRYRFHPDVELLIRSTAPDAVLAFAREVDDLARRWFGDEQQ